MKRLLVLIGVFCSLVCQAQEEVDSLRNVIENLSGEDRIQTRFVLVNWLINIDPAEAKSEANRILSESNEIGHELGKSQAYFAFGVTYNVLNQIDSAIFLLEKARVIAKDIDHQLQISRTGVALGAAYLKRYQLSLAMTSLQEALVASKVLENRSLEMSCLMNIAIVNTYLKDAESAERNLQKALEISSEMRIPIRTGQIYGNLGNLEFDRANYSLSYGYFLKALEKFQQVNASQMIAVVYTQMGRASSKLERMTDALGYYDEAYKIRDEAGDKRGLISVLRYKAQTLLDLRRYEDCESLIKNDIGQKALETDDPFILMDIENINYQLAEYRQNYGLALTHFKQYQIHKDTVDAREQREAVKLQNAEFNNAQLSLELQQERQQKEIAELKRSRQRLIIIVLLLLIVASSIVYFINRSRLQKQLIIKEKDKELLNQRVEDQASRISKFESEISKLEVEFSESAENKEKLIEILDGAKTEGKDWAYFTILFEKIYPGALSSFKQYNLTLNDQRLVAQIILGLSTKEMSSILNITPKSVSKAKGRLSTKLGLSDTRDLDRFILNQLENHS
ncbi:MAG: hypothetical protein HEP71_33485 [Roseivirga sp.]|nr:hypothetical protein [Roseivirga sp.]